MAPPTMPNSARMPAISMVVLIQLLVMVSLSSVVTKRLHDRCAVQNISSFQRLALKSGLGPAGPGQLAEILDDMLLAPAHRHPLG